MTPPADDAGTRRSLRFACPPRHPEEAMTITSTEVRSGAVLRRLAPLAGVLFAVLTIASYLTMDAFPDGSTPAGDLPAFYAAHGGRVSLGGVILGVAGMCFGVFGVTVWARLRDRRVPAVVAGVALLGAAVDTMADLNSAAVYNLLGSIGVDPHVTVPALQAWHISGAEFGVGGGAVLFLLATAVAGIAYRAVPRWVAWTGLALAVAPFLPSPFGFFGSLIFLPWAASAGLALALRPDVQTPRTGPVPAPVG
jgi:hypothetical protein